MPSIRLKNNHHRKAVKLTLEGSAPSEGLTEAYFTPGLKRSVRKAIGRALNDSVETFTYRISPGEEIFIADSDITDDSRRYFQARKFAENIINGQGPFAEYMEAEIIE